MIHPVTVARNLASRLRALRRMEIGPRDVVLEIGSGQNPNPRANVLCDRYLVDDTERNERPVTVDRPFVVGDVHALPFADGSFDYVICAHVLEHVDDPSAAIAELTRVARRGYVETPSRVNERLHSFPFHRWTVTEEGGEMVFREKPRAVLDPELSEWFERLSARLPGFTDFYLANLHELGNVAGIVWEGQLPHRVEWLPGSGPGSRPEWATGAEAPDPAAELSAAREALAAGPGGDWRSTAWSRLARHLRRHSDPLTSLEDRLACPACGGEVALGPEAAECASCGRRYPVLDAGGRRVPWLVPGAPEP